MGLEAEVKEVAAAVEGEAKKIEEALVIETKAAGAEVGKVAGRLRVDITADEKLLLRDAETEFLRAQVNIRDIQTKLKEETGKAEAATKKYSSKLEELVVKYGIDKAGYVFDNLENTFKAVAKQL